MLVAPRRALLAAAPLAAGTVIAAALLRKPGGPAQADVLNRDAPQAGAEDAARLQPYATPVALPAFGFSDAEGRTQRLEDYRGRGVVLNFWASWCRPCVAEMHALDQLATQAAPHGIAVLAVSSDQGGAAMVQAFYHDHGIAALPVLLDAGMEAGHILGLRGIPTTLLINAAGEEVARLEGGANWTGTAMIHKIVALIGVS